MTDVPRLAAADAAVLRSEGIVLDGGHPPISFAVRSGEIVGFAGLEGHGQEELLEILAGLRRPVAGTVVVRNGLGIERRVSSQRSATRQGVAYLPRDRKSEGIFPSMSIVDNFAIAALASFSVGGVLKRRELRHAFADARDSLGIVAGSDSDSISTLSGGNQQKVLLGRALALAPSVLLLNDPTRGVDANAKASFYALFRSLAERGMATVILSTELKELVALCDRVLVLHQHALALTCADSNLTEPVILAGMFGREQEGWNAT